MNYVDNIGSSSAGYSFKSRDGSVSDSIQSSHNSSIGDSQESLTSPVVASYGLTVLPVKDSLAGLAISQQNSSWANSQPYTSMNQFQTPNLHTNQMPISSVVESSNKVLISMPQQQYIQIIQSPNGIAIPSSQTTEVMQMPNNNNSSNREIEELAVTTHIESFKKPSRLYSPPGNPPLADSLLNSQFYSISQNNVTASIPHSPQAPLLQGVESPRFILSSQPGPTPETFQIIQAISKPGQQPTQNIQQLIFPSNQPNGNIQYSIIAPTFANPAGPPQTLQAIKPVSPPRQAKGHKHLQNYPFNSRPHPMHIKVEQGSASYVQMLGNPPLLQQSSAPDLELDHHHHHHRSESGGTGLPRKRKTGVPRKYVQNPKIKKECSEGGEEMDYSQEGDDNSDELSGSPFGTESFPEMEYSPDSDSCSFAPAGMEQQLFPRIMLTEGSKVSFTTWNEYCQLTGSRPAPYALHNQNNNLLPESNLFQVGTNLEILERTPDRHFTIRPVTVTKILGSRLRLELLASAGGQSLWTTVDSYRLHYLGWGSERGLSYLPPDDLQPNINWHEYIHSILAVQDNSNIDMFRASFDQEMGAFFTLFRPGMLLEAAMDPLNRELISVCVVKRCSGQTVLLYEQNEDELSEFSRFYQEFSVDSPYIRPLGWANKHRKQLRPSKESSNSKDWPHLLAKIIIHKNRLPVPLEAFNRTSCFCPGMKLEAVDWKEPEKIRVATVIALNDKQQIKVHYDGLSADMEHWADVDAKEIFPPGYCDTTGHHLEKPHELDISQAAPALLCPLSYRYSAHTFQPTSVSSHTSPRKLDSPPQEELAPSPPRPPPIPVLQHKVTVTLYVSHASFPGPYLNPELFNLIPPVIGPTTPTQAQAMLLTHLLDASINRPLLWDRIEDSPGPSAVPLLYEPNSSICKQLPFIESFHELFLFLNKLRDKLEFGPDFIRIGAPPANHEVHQPERIPSSIPPLTLPQSKYTAPTPTQPHQNPILSNHLRMSNMSNQAPSAPPHPQAVVGVHPDPSMVQSRQPQSMQLASTPINANMFQSKPPTPPYRSPGTNARPVLQIHNNLPETSSTCVIPPPSNYVNGNSYPPKQVVSSHPASWTVEQVCEFIRSTDQANSDDVVGKFRQQKIDGASLVELKVELLVNFLKLELGPALKIMRHIEQLISNSSSRREPAQSLN